VEVIHKTPFEAAMHDVLDCDGSIARVVIFKATFELAPRGRVVVAAEQDPIHQMDEWLGKPGESSAVFESDLAYFKPASDIVFVGSVHAPRGAASSFPVSITVGHIRKAAVVHGDRHWDCSALGVHKSSSRPVSAVPICWERSFGGWDRSDSNPRNHQMDRRNPIGTGFAGTGSSKALQGLALPNFENPAQPITSWKTRPVPWGFGFVGRGWLPRANYAGTYDETWQKTRMPVAPRDFDYRFFNGAPPDQIYPGYLQGDELVRAVNFSPAGEDTFQLPSMRVRFSGLCSGKSVTSDAVLDTAVFALDRRRFSLAWRAKYRIQLRERSETVTAQVDGL
jgi:hypothetical protein